MSTPLNVRQGLTSPLPFDPNDPEFLNSLGFDPSSSVKVEMKIQIQDTREKNKWIDIPNNNLTGLRISDNGIYWDVKGLPPVPTRKSISNLFPIETKFEVHGLPVSIMRLSTIHYPNVPNNVVKFTENKFAPYFCGNIQIGTPAYYRSLPISSNTENTRDELESIIDDEYANKTYKEDSFFMYCTTITDDLCAGKEIPKDYQSATRIVNPSKFAEVLGREFVEQFICPFKDQSPEQDLSVEVIHGNVHYIEETNEKMDFQGFMKTLGVSNKYVQYFLPFLKRKRFDFQQEYRFVVRAIGRTISDDVPDQRRFFLLNTSEDLLKLMSWPQNLNPEKVILLFLFEDNWVNVRTYDLSTNDVKDLNTEKARDYINLDLLNVDVSQFFETGKVNVNLQNGALYQGDLVDRFALGIIFKESKFPIALQKINFLK